MKYTITLLTLISTLACLHAVDNPHENRFKANRERLRTAPGKTAPELPHVKREQAPATMQDLVAVVDDEEAFMKRLRKHLSDTPGCTTWDESCTSSCPTWNTEIANETDYLPDISELPGFDEPITCKKLLSPCYQSLRGTSQEDLDSRLSTVIFELISSRTYSKARCKAIALICQGANPNTKVRILDRTALHSAALMNDHEFAKFLLINAKADIDPKTMFDRTPLDYNIIDAGSAETLQLFIEHRANVNTISSFGYTPFIALAFFCRKYNETLIKEKALLLTNAGAETHDRAKDGLYVGKTALKIARLNQKEYDSSACEALGDFIESYEKQPKRIQD